MDRLRVGGSGRCTPRSGWPVIGWDLGIEGVTFYNAKAFCASGAWWIPNIAPWQLASGAHDVASGVVGVVKMSSRDGAGALTSDGMPLEGESELRLAGY